MKQLVGTDIGTYTFSPSTKQITFGGFPNNYLIGIQQLLIITNVTTGNTIIYNFASSTQGGTISNNVLTLTYNTTSMNATDQLQIYIDVEIVNETLQALLRRMNKLLESNAVVDANLRQRVAVEAMPTVTINSPAVTIAAGQGPLGTANANYQGAVLPNVVTSQNVQYIGEGPVDQRYRVMDDAHVAYATAIRANLVY